MPKVDIVCLGVLYKLAFFYLRNATLLHKDWLHAKGTLDLFPCSMLILVVALVCYIFISLNSRSYLVIMHMRLPSPTDGFIVQYKGTHSPSPKAEGNPYGRRNRGRAGGEAGRDAQGWQRSGEPAMLGQCIHPCSLAASDGFRKTAIVVFGSAPSLKTFILGGGECYHLSLSSKQSFGKLGSKIIWDLKHNHQLLGLDLENPQTTHPLPLSPIYREGFLWLAFLLKPRSNHSCR